ncbi:TRAP transporter substrate-binding protein DctP [Steroidobacter agaridevorans]|uniref:TRAP transporter substrate-binding protein DctP n=1 Tax=Steroidobacter agaridevorans TaxID=2695856 RepID=UPI001379A835|nr:TRAP transporter substrate-binding protein DctP [Steroidobacter agaridevorans]
MRVLLALLIICIAGCTQPTPGVTVLTYASPFSPGHPFSRADIAWMKWVEQQSDGRIEIQPYWSGSLLSSEHSMHELRHGVADIGLITPIYARGGAHLIRAQAGFYGGLTTFEQQTALWRCMAAADPQFGRELHGLKILAVQGGNLPGIVTRDRAIRTLDDLRGLRLRAPSELLAVLKDLGADPIDMPMGEVYSALAKGVLDGVVAPPDTLKSLHFAEVAKYFNTIRIPRGAYAARAIGERRWRSLTAEQRDLLERSTEVWEQSLAAELLVANDVGLAAGREHHVEFHDMPAAEQARFDAIYERDGEVRARALARFGIDGLPTYRLARSVAAQVMDDGGIRCSRDQT